MSHGAAIRKPLPRSYAERRQSLLIELRVMRLTKPTKRVVKHMQRLMRGLRWMRTEGLVK